MNNKYHESAQDLLKSRFEKLEKDLKKSKRARLHDKEKAKGVIAELKEEMEQLREELTVAKVNFRTLLFCRFCADRNE